MKKIAVTGLSGVIGSRLLPFLPSNVTIFDLYNTTPSSLLGYSIQSYHFDLTSPKECLKTLRQLQPDVIVHMAAVTHIDRCEEYRHQKKDSVAWKINVMSVDAIASYCIESGAKLVYLSTECVFDGKSGMYTEHAETHPINWYGHMKAEAEEIIMNKDIPAAILRSVVAFDPRIDSKTIYGHFAGDLQKGKEIRVVDDLFLMPTWVDDIAKMIVLLFKKKNKGIFHLTSPHIQTPYSFALNVAAHIKALPELIIPVPSLEFFGSRRAQLRLQHSTLDSRLTLKAVGFAGSSIESVLV